LTLSPDDIWWQIRGDGTDKAKLLHRYLFFIAAFRAFPVSAAEVVPSFGTQKFVTTRHYGSFFSDRHNWKRPRGQNVRAVVY
jgi:hypothetical protein